MVETVPAFAEYRNPPEAPLPLMRSWLDAARQAGAREPGAFALATAGLDGKATNRVCQLLDVTERGLVFATHATSAKGRQIGQTGWSAAAFYWREQGRQLLVSGPTVRLSDGASDRLWQARPRLAHAMSTLAKQSQPLRDEQVLRSRAAALCEASQPLPRPPAWAGYVIEPEVVEFWQADPERLHQRLEYRRTVTGWTATRLQP